MSMNSPYEGNFQVTQIQHSSHDGFDLVGIDHTEIHSTVTGTVVHAGWENPYDQKQGFGQYVCIKSDADGYYYYFGHMKEIKTTEGAHVNITDVIGIQGHTGHTIPDNENGTHCHYCCRKFFAVGNALNISQLSGIPNVCGVYNDGYTGYNSKNEDKPTTEVVETPETVIEGGTIKINGVTYKLILEKE